MPESGVHSLSGRLLVTDWNGGPDDSPPPDRVTGKQLQKGLSIPIEIGRTYNLDVVVIPEPDKTAVLRVAIDTDVEKLENRTCEATDGSPLCAFEVTRI
jgi:hypothetical protein